MKPFGLSIALLTGFLSVPLAGCALPAVSKLAKPKPTFDQYSCGEDCPKPAKSVKRTDG